MDKDAFSLLQSSAGKKGIVRRDEDLRHGRGLVPIKLRRDARQIAFRHDDQLRLRAASRDPENALADLPRPDRVSHGFHLASEFEPGNVLRITRRRGIFSLALHEVGAIEAGAVDADPDAVGGWPGRRIDLLETDSLDPAMRSDNNRAPTF